MSPEWIRSSTCWPAILETWAMSCVWIPYWSGVCNPLFSVHFCHHSTQDLGVFHPTLWQRPDRSSSLPVSCSANHLSAEWSWEKDWLAQFSWLKAAPPAFRLSSFRDGNGYWLGAWEVEWSLGNALCLAWFAVFDRPCSASQGLPCVITVLRTQVPKFCRRCQSLAGHTYEREVIVLTSWLLCKLTKGKDQLLCGAEFTSQLCLVQHGAPGASEESLLKELVWEG